LRCLVWEWCVCTGRHLFVLNIRFRFFLRFPLYHNETLRSSFLDRDTNATLTDSRNALHLLIFSSFHLNPRGKILKTLQRSVLGSKFRFLDPYAVFFAIYCDSHRSISFFGFTRAFIKTNALLTIFYNFTIYEI